jgi:ATP-dependent Lhr-like helicase
VAGRWSLLPEREPDLTVRAHALARTLLDRHGVVTRGAVAAEGVEGGFSAIYRILSAFEDSGQARRGYVVEGLGAAQFAMDGAVDRLRAAANARDRGETLSEPVLLPNGFPDQHAFPGDRYSASTSSFPTDSGSAGTSDSPDGHTSASIPDFPGEATSPPRDAPSGHHSFPGDGDHNSSSPNSPDPADPLSRFNAPSHPGAPGGLHDPGAFDPANSYDFPPDSDPTDGHGFSANSADSAFSTRSASSAGPGFPNTVVHPGNRPRSRSRAGSQAVVLAAADPANAYGAALPWPEPPTGAGHKPGRKAGSLVVLVDGELTLYMERGGKTLLAWPADPDGTITQDARLRVAAESLAAAARAGSLGTVTVERVNGTSALTSPFGTLLEGAGFIATPRGLRLRA